jgi:hypothetical protein
MVFVVIRVRLSFGLSSWTTFQQRREDLASVKSYQNATFATKMRHLPLQSGLCGGGVLQKSVGGIPWNCLKSRVK